MRRIPIPLRHPSRESRSRGRGSVVIASIALVLFAVVGCSAGGSSAGGSEAGGAGDAEGAAQEGAVAEADRSVVIEGSMRIVVDDVAAATSEAATIVVEADGRIDGRDEFTEPGAPQTSSTTMTLRIPAEALEGTLDELRAIGTVQSVQTSSTDVTTSVQDVDAHIAALESTIARLQSFQGSSTSVADLLAIEKEISSRQAELEQYRAQEVSLSERTAFSTITLTLLASALSVSAAPGDFAAGFAVGWNSFIAFTGGLVIALGVALPWLIAGGLIAAAIVFPLRRRRRRRQAAAAASGEPVAHAAYSAFPAYAGAPVPPVHVPHTHAPDPHGAAAPLQTPQAPYPPTL